MTLNDLDFLRLLPSFMRGDPAVIGLSRGVDGLTPSLARGTRRLAAWDSIDELSEAELDDLAWELNILWYDRGAAPEVKRALVKDSDRVYQHLGTKWAVENVITACFGEGYLREWFEYEGEPGHFRVYSSNPSLSNERLGAFLNLLNKVKRTGAWLDGIYITLTGEMHLSAGAALHEVGEERYAIGGAI